MEFEFVLKCKLPEGSTDANALVERLGEAGCDDAVVGIGRPGRIALNFTRDADSVNVSISALEDVKRAILDAELIEASPDLSGLTDIAEFVGVTRQNMLAPVLEWLSDRAGHAIEQRLIETARIASKRPARPAIG